MCLWYEKCSYLCRILFLIMWTCLCFRPQKSPVWMHAGDMLWKMQGIISEKQYHLFGYAHVHTQTYLYGVLWKMEEIIREKQYYLFGLRKEKLKTTIIYWYRGCWYLSHCLSYKVNISCRNKLQWSLANMICKNGPTFPWNLSVSFLLISKRMVVLRRQLCREKWMEVGCVEMDRDCQISKVDFKYVNKNNESTF